MNPDPQQSGFGCGPDSYVLKIPDNMAQVGLEHLAGTTYTDASPKHCTPEQRDSDQIDVVAQGL